ncbi:MAG TPA: 50S ribosomal protein L17 [Defluviitoga sp.]|nr:50S ribosomal protein L17 [Defluviitoga sp.]HOP25155.1 50S ribosomal protein L17 [Defluviitoga sp.]HPZ28355.1 50S ribosomal protein L17 [Defluviitoga sp.]HQD62245.1 50S ribosomal protein L17 [Defluviitoga sp.]
MRHRVKKNKLNRYASHRKAMLNNLARSVFESESIITTTAKAKEVRPLVENIITKAKKANAATSPEEKMALNREINKHFNDRKLVYKIVHEIAPRYQNRDGGYTRILKIGNRRGDGAELSILQLIPEKE